MSDDPAEDPTYELVLKVLGIASARLYNDVGLHGLGSLAVRELTTTYGVKKRDATKIAAFVELAKRRATLPFPKGKPFMNSTSVFRHFGPILRELDVEQFRIVLLDGKHCMISEHLISQGTLTSSPVHPREIFKVAIRRSAAAIILGDQSTPVTWP